MPAPVGTWRRLVADLNGVQGVPGSNPGVPTKQTPTRTNPPKPNPRVFLTFREITRGSPFSSCWLLLVFFRVRIRTQVRTHDCRAGRNERLSAFLFHGARPAD